MGRQINAQFDPTKPCRCHKSGFGKQSLSQRQSFPSFGFGSGSRDALTHKTYMSPEHAKVAQGNNSLGPIYKNQGSVGKQIESEKQSSPATGFGTEHRAGPRTRVKVPGPGQYKVPQAFGVQQNSKKQTGQRPVMGSSTRDQQNKLAVDEEMAKTYYGKWSPAPNTYNLKSSIGAQDLSTKPSLPQWRFGSEPRGKPAGDPASQDFPGAGQYKRDQSIGKMVQSKKKSMPMFSFDKQTRDRILRKQFLSQEHEKQNYGQETPGPATGIRYSSVGRQNLSTRPSQPGWGFGKSRRLFVDHFDEIPGPGTYCI